MTNKRCFQGGVHKSPPLLKGLWAVDGHRGWVGEPVSFSGVVHGRLSTYKRINWIQ